MTEIHGDVAPGFEKVRDAFQKNFDEGKEIGAAFSAYHRGTKVVDLWGGVADQESGKPWEQDTIILVFSTTKGATAICANKLAQEGRLDVDAPVVEYWPEFGANGKQDVPVSYLLSHQTGLAWIDGEMSTEDALSWDPVDRSTGRPEAFMGARISARLPRHDLRVVGRRGDSSDQWQERRHVLP